MEKINCTFTDVSGASTQGQAQLETLTTGQKFARGFKRGGIFFGIGLLFLPVPGLHLLCIPIFLIAIWQGTKIGLERQLIRHADGVCPNCKNNVSFEGPINALESKEICPECRQLLKLRPLHLRAV